MHPDYFDCVDVRVRLRTFRKARWQRGTAAAAEMGISKQALDNVEMASASVMVRSVIDHAARLGLTPAQIAVIVDDDESASSRPPRVRAPREPKTPADRVVWCLQMIGLPTAGTQILKRCRTHDLRTVRSIAAELAVTPSFLLDLDYAAEPRWFKAWADAPQALPEKPQALTVGPKAWFRCADCGSNLTMPHPPKVCARMAAAHAAIAARPADATGRRAVRDGSYPRTAPSP
ncbi:MAG: hypothetical protein QG602_3027 [Verrucomicrobiota bacterium]|jgi:hypothetical protein|nr:hypothetical protein [Verrucomicrobiota bacterium]